MTFSTIQRLAFVHLTVFKIQKLRKTMDKIQKLNGAKCDTPLPDAYIRFYNKMALSLIS